MNSINNPKSKVKDGNPPLPSSNNPYHGSSYNYTQTQPSYYGSNYDYSGYGQQWSQYGNYGNYGYGGYSYGGY